MSRDGSVPPGNVVPGDGCSLVTVSPQTSEDTWVTRTCPARTGRIRPAITAGPSSASAETRDTVAPVRVGPAAMARATGGPAPTTLTTGVATDGTQAGAGDGLSPGRTPAVTTAAGPRPGRHLNRAGGLRRARGGVAATRRRPAPVRWLMIFGTASAWEVHAAARARPRPVRGRPGRRRRDAIPGRAIPALAMIARPATATPAAFTAPAGRAATAATGTAVAGGAAAAAAAEGRAARADRAG